MYIGLNTSLLYIALVHFDDMSQLHVVSFLKRHNSCPFSVCVSEVFVLHLYFTTWNLVHRETREGSQTKYSCKRLEERKEKKEVIRADNW